MTRGRRILRHAIGLAAAGAAGGAATLGAVAAAGGLDSTTTVRELAQAPPPGQVSLGRNDRDTLTVAQLYERAAPGVVQVAAASSAGSGFVLDKAGHVVTSYRVVRGAESVQVSFSNEDRMRAGIVGVDPSSGLAVVQVAARSRALEPLPLGDSELVQVGDPVVAIGNASGRTRTAAAGIVSELAAAAGVIRTDAALDAGYAGGPLLDAAGRVIGVASRTAPGSAVPIDVVKQVAAQLIATGRAERAYLGLLIGEVDPRLARALNLPARRGLLVERVERGGPAAAAGLHGGSTPVVVAGESYVVGGDLIVDVDGRRATTDGALRDVLAGKRPGDRVSLEVYRGSRRMTVTAKLGRQPTSPRS